MRRVEGVNGVIFYQSERLLALGVRHAFSTRIGGVSPAPFTSLNLGNPSGCESPDSDANLAENYRRLTEAADLPPARLWSFQVHGHRVLKAEAGRPFECGIEADGLTSDDPTRSLSIRAADCAAVLIASSDGAVIATAHAGWRGVTLDVIPHTARAMRERGATPFAAAVFPCISVEHFEVGSEVVTAFRNLGLPAYFVDAGGRAAETDHTGKGRADVTGACVRQLLASGIAPDHIDASDLCTFSRSDEFFSHRRDKGLTGRMALLAAPASHPRATGGGNHAR